MNKFKLADQYIIEFEKNNNIKWYEFVEQDATFLVFEGDAFLDRKNSIIFLSPWKNTYEIEKTDEKELSEWDVTKYYATVSDTGTMKIFDIETDYEVDDKKLRELSISIGCTMKYR